MKPASEAGRRDGDDRSATLRDGWRLYGQGRLEEARGLMMPDAAQRPNDPEPAYLLGMIFKAQGEYDNAVKAFNAVRRSLDGAGDRTRAEMLRRLAQANLELLDRRADVSRDKRP